jgi:hypothetical protein
MVGRVFDHGGLRDGDADADAERRREAEGDHVDDEAGVEFLKLYRPKVTPNLVRFKFVITYVLK